MPLAMLAGAQQEGYLVTMGRRPTDGSALIRMGARYGRLVAELRGHSASVRSAVYNPDGRRVVSARNVAGEPCRRRVGYAGGLRTSCG